MVGLKKELAPAGFKKAPRCWQERNKLAAAHADQTDSRIFQMLA
jgi:hypothetical protein